MILGPNCKDPINHGATLPNQKHARFQLRECIDPLSPTQKSYVANSKGR